MKKYNDADVLNIINEVQAAFSDLKIKKSEAVKEKLNKNETEATENNDLEKDEPLFDPKEVEELYKSFNKEELEAHYSILKNSVIGEKMEKSEDSISKAEFETLQKSNTELSKENEELKKNLDKVSEVLRKIVKTTTVPAQKAITNKQELEYVKKNENDGSNGEVEKVLTKKEIANKLTEKIRSGSLEKSEREKINTFYSTGSLNIDLIKHLL
jgi:hypothetical protein